MKPDEVSNMFNFDRPLTPYCFIECPDCFVGSPIGDWNMWENFDDYGDFWNTLVCPDCGECFNDYEDIKFMVYP